MEHELHTMGLGQGGGLRVQGDGVRAPQPDRAALLQALMQRLAPLQQQNPQAYQMIMAKIQEKMGGGGQGFIGRQDRRITNALMPPNPMQGPQAPMQGAIPQLAMLQQQNPQIYQAIMQRLGTGPSPVGPDSQFMNRFPNRAPARFPNPLGGP